MVYDPRNIIKYNNMLSDKILNLEELKYIINNEKYVMINGCYNFIHLAHIRSMEAIKQHYKNYKLIVFVNNDESIDSLKNNRISNIDYRLEYISKIPYVDYVTPFNTKRISEFYKENYLMNENLMCWIKGKDYFTNKNIDQNELDYFNDIPIKFIDNLMEDLHTTDILKELK